MSDRLVDLRESALDGSELERAVAHDGAGAVVGFVGRVRSHNDGMPVTLLEYEAYSSMAVKEMTRIVQEIESRIEGTRLAVVHRVGTLRVGEAAIICAASAPHRSEAFEACRQLIDEVKARVPIWKREHGPDGPYWVGWADARCHPGHGHHDHRGDHGDHGHSGHAHVHGPAASHAPDEPAAQRPTLAGLRVVCITVSDTRQTDDDESGCLAAKLFAEKGAQIERAIVRDEADRISAVVKQHLATAPDAIFLTGGTGIGPRDVTPEAILPLLERTLDGFGEAFRRLSFEQIGSRGLLSRALAGVVDHTVLFAVPGSPKAVRLAVDELVVPMLPHALAMSKGGGHA